MTRSHLHSKVNIIYIKIKNINKVKYNRHVKYNLDIADGGCRSLYILGSFVETVHKSRCQFWCGL